PVQLWHLRASPYRTRFPGAAQLAWHPYLRRHLARWLAAPPRAQSLSLASSSAHGVHAVAYYHAPDLPYHRREPLRSGDHDVHRPVPDGNPDGNGRTLLDPRNRRRHRGLLQDPAANVVHGYRHRSRSQPARPGSAPFPLSGDARVSHGSAIVDWPVHRL